MGFSYLLTYDSISFNSHLETILTSATLANAAPSVALGLKSKANNQSPWLYLDAANTLFHAAKRRAYIPPPKKRKKPSAVLAGGTTDENADAEDALREIEREESQARDEPEEGQGRDGNWPPGVQPVLEELPKWGLLAGVLEEIEEEITALKATGESQSCPLGTKIVLELTRHPVWDDPSQTNLAQTPFWSWPLPTERALNSASTSLPETRRLLCPRPPPFPNRHRTSLEKT